MARPNVLFLFSDQQRWDTLGCCGQPLPVSPYLDRMAREGTRFDMTCLARIESRDDVKRWEETGMTRLIVTPWNRGKEALDGIRRFADQIFDRS